MIFIISLSHDSLSFWVKDFFKDTTKRLENFRLIQMRLGGAYLKTLEVGCCNKQISKNRLLFN